MCSYVKLKLFKNIYKIIKLKKIFKLFKYKIKRYLSYLNEKLYKMIDCDIQVPDYIERYLCAVCEALS